LLGQVQDLRTQSVPIEQPLARELFAACCFYSSSTGDAKDRVKQVQRENHGIATQPPNNSRMLSYWWVCPLRAFVARMTGAPRRCLVCSLSFALL